ncbi:TlpA family protein disulfide reductase [Streptacidiphilus rugosus]|uniref:TlpA family protein disulfide reductase n=1 Tax=Streptacidiphilus rugosus TaxID=405783 RepID=UPI000567BFD3|nr:thioredoxin family protein [Streptacidiphilus rugosus]
MIDPTGLAVALAVLAAATVFGLLRARRDGRLRAASGSAALRFSADELGDDLGARATLVQFSTSFCANCPGTRRLLAEVAGTAEGVRVIEIDAESRLDLVRRADVMRTPTVLVLDRAGHLVRRSSGAPGRAELLTAVELATAV